MINKKILKPIITLKAEEPELKMPKSRKKEYKEVGGSIEVCLQEDSTASLVISASKETSTPGASPHIDVRTYLESEKYTGPTKKGVNFDVINTPEVVAAIVKKYLDTNEGDINKIFSKLESALNITIECLPN